MNLRSVMNLAGNILAHAREAEIHCYCLTNLLKPTSYMIHQQFNIQQLYTLPTLHLCVLYLSENKQRLVPLIS